MAITKELKQIVTNCKAMNFTEEEMLFLINDREKFNELYEERFNKLIKKKMIKKELD